MVLFIFGIDENIVQIYDDEDVSHVAEYVVHEVLESGGSVGHSEWHYQVFERSVTSSESGFPFMTFSYAHVVVAYA
jgi:hypothetical protein